jgi:ethanolamine utilization protein EutQ (cupin superfamily)
MYKIIRKSEATVRQIADNKLALNYVTKDLSPEVSLAVTEATDYYEKEITDYNRIYYVLEGELVLAFDGNEVKLSAGDSCFVGKGTGYEMSGTFKAVMVNQPAFGTA